LFQLNMGLLLAEALSLNYHSDSSSPCG